MADTVIEVENLWKEYRLGVISHHTLSRDLQSWWATVRGKDDPNSPVGTGLSTVSLPPLDGDRFWALQNCSFEVKQGDLLGIVGPNGAGKSTLLKILSQVTAPSKGEVRFKGRLASLLEVGTGFHPELTGRENIFLNGAILGMSKGDIRQKLDEIIAFAEVEKFLDTPVKRYSSGMYVRLAFAVAAHLEPEILIVDEVLAVGDARFQRKCLGKMEQVGKEGRTVLFVSHNLEALLNLCTKGVLLQGGRLVAAGSAREVVHHYVNQYATQKTLQHWTDLETAPGNDKAKLVKAQVRPSDGSCDTICSDAPFEFDFTFFSMIPGESNLDVTYHLLDERRVLVYVGSTAFSRNDSFKPGFLRATCRVYGNLLSEGTYTVSRLLLVKDRGTIVYEHKDVLSFQVVHPSAGREGWSGEKEGVIRPKLDWDLYPCG